VNLIVCKSFHKTLFEIFPRRKNYLKKSIFFFFLLTKKKLFISFDRLVLPLLFLIFDFTEFTYRDVESGKKDNQIWQQPVSKEGSWNSNEEQVNFSFSRGIEVFSKGVILSNHPFKNY